MDYKEICERVTTGLIDQHLVAFREETPENMAGTLAQAQRLEQLQASLSPEQNKLLEEYVGGENALGFEKYQHIYLAGALDAVRLLRQLGVFG